MIREATVRGLQIVEAGLRDTEVGVREHGFEEARRQMLNRVMDSQLCWEISNRDNVPVALFGGEVFDGHVECWLFCTALVSECPVELVKGIRSCLAWGLDRWPEMRIQAERRDEKQKRFLRLLGFRTRNVSGEYEELSLCRAEKTNAKR